MAKHPAFPSQGYLCGRYFMIVLHHQVDGINLYKIKDANDSLLQLPKLKRQANADL